ncbi:hypothetical protein DFH09DRAFT_1457152 [Mycena vulgaris]|nr:hypothetical protein DFH09DRAFT_1457152 [Mycena vulgaris]
MPFLAFIRRQARTGKRPGFLRTRSTSPHPSLYKDWYTDPTLPRPWSTDWDDWDYLLRLFEQTVDGKLKIKKLFKDVFDVPGSVEPVAYMRAACGEVWLFTAGGRYYFWSDGYLAVHRMEFASPKEFLEHALQGKSPGEHLPDVEISMRPGTDLSWL